MPDYDRPPPRNSFNSEMIEQTQAAGVPAPRTPTYEQPRFRMPQGTQYDAAGNAIPDSGGTVTGPNANQAVEVNPSTGLPNDPEEYSGSLAPDWVSNLQHEVSEGLGLPTIGGAAQTVGGAVAGAAGATGRAIGGAANWVQRAARGELEMSPETAEAVNEAAQGPADAYQDIAGVTGGTTEGPPNWQRGLGWYADTSGATDLWNTSRSVISDPTGAAQNVWTAADTAVTNPTEVWRGAQRIVPMVWDYYKENPEEIGRLAWGAAISAGTGAIVRSGVGAATSAVRGAAASSRLARGATKAIDVAEDAARITRPARRVLDRAEDVEDVVNAARRAAPPTRVARPTIRGALAEGADTAIERLDRGLNRAIATREGIRNTVMNLPRRALGMEEKDLRIGAVARARERAATHITQGAGVEGTDSNLKQLLSSRVGPTRQMPELPEGVGRRTQANIENYWRKSAFNKVLPGGNPTGEINNAIAIAEDPLGYLADRFLHGGGGGEDDWATGRYMTPGQARGYSRSRAPVQRSATPTTQSADQAGFYQRTPAATISLQSGTSNPYTGNSGYQPGRGWKMANSPMYQDEQEPLYG
jgi:hypothetical protein